MATALGPPVYALSRAGLGMLARHYGGGIVRRASVAGLTTALAGRALSDLELEDVLDLGLEVSEVLREM